MHETLSTMMAGRVFLFCKLEVVSFFTIISLKLVLLSH